MDDIKVGDKVTVRSYDNIPLEVVELLSEIDVKEKTVAVLSGGDYTALR